IGISNVDWLIGVDVNLNYNQRTIMIDVLLVFLTLTLYLIALYIGTRFYISNKKLLSKQLQLIYFDGLTELPNRLKLKEDVTELISHNKAFYLGFGDLDNFKTINDIMGHSVGDEYLKITASRFHALANEKLSIYRWGGDEFIFIVKTSDKDEAIQIYDRIYNSLDEPITVNHIDYSASLSMGIVQYPRHGITIDDLIKRADIVMYDVKQNNKKAYNFFENRYLDSLQREVDFENKVNQYSFDDYQVYLQPIVNTETNEVYGFEGLTRLFDKSNKPLNTIDVIKVLERQGKIPELDMHVFDTVTQYAKQLKQRFKKDYYFSFNVSPVTLSEDFVTYLADKVKAEHLDPTHFIFEIIETIGFKNIDESVSLLQKLRNIGFQIAMDDFG
ncbi:MAG TPA: diguanylate cyclase, partial [Bacillota bacterium]|nr:diguanylate cyclase [Bacillota bacterium]